MPTPFRPRGSPTAEYSPQHDYTGWDLIHRGTMAPWGVYEKDGQTASGFAWPGMVTEPLEAGGRFFSPGGGFEQGPANVNAAGEANISPSWSPQERDAMTELLTLYGGNALNGTARAGASAIGNALADPARIGLRDYGTAAYKSLMHHNEPAVMGSIPSEFLPAVNYSVNNPKSPWSKDHGSLASLHLRGSDLKLLPPSNEVVGALTPDEAGYLNALMQTRKPESQTFNVIDGGLFSDTGRPSIMGSALAGGKGTIEEQIAEITASTRPHRAASKPGNSGPMRLYHGTGRAFEKFGTDDVWATSDPALASQYAMLDGNTNPNVVPLDASFKNIMRTADYQNPGDSGIAHRDRAVQMGADAIDYGDGVFAAIGRGTLKSPYTGETLFSDTGRPSILGSALAAEQSPLPPNLLDLYFR